MDPFSLTTGVAGFVSLGLTLCDGIVTYCRDYHSQSRDIEALSQHADQLQTYLRLFEHRAAGNGRVDASLKFALGESLDACVACILEVESLASKYTLPNRQVKGFSIRGNAVMDRLKYPFHKHELQSFREQLNDLRTALYGYQLLLNQYVILQVALLKGWRHQWTLAQHGFTAKNL